MQQLSRNPEDYQPSNITFSHLAPWVPAVGPNGKPVRLQKRAKYEAMAERALVDLAAWIGVTAPIERPSAPAVAPAHAEP